MRFMSRKVSHGGTPDDLGTASNSAHRSRRNLLGREIAAMLAVKLLVLYGIWNAFFSQPLLPKMIAGMDPGRVAAVLIASDAPPAPTFQTTPNPHPKKAQP
jgi:hypothetical protein